VFQRRDKYFAVADFASFRTFNNRLDYSFNAVVRNGNLDFRFGQKVDDVFGASIEFRMPALPAEAFDLTDGHALDADFTQRIPDIIQSKGLNDRGYELHVYRSCI
jgi:hypothetical protein